MINNFSEEELFASGHRACAGCGEALTVRWILKAAGKNTVIVSNTGCMEVVSSPYPETAWEVPWVHAAFENGPAVASGIVEGLKKQGKKDGTNVIVIGGDGSSFDIGFQSLSGALERGHDFLYVATDNEAYMNTGVQRSSATFPYANTTTTPAGTKIPGKEKPKKLLPLIVASHGIKYTATASIANIPDLVKKVKKALTIKGPKFLHTFCPCPVGWNYPGEKTIEMAKLAIETGVTPIYEIENGELKFTQKIENRKPVEEYLKHQGRFKHLTPELIKEIQKYVDDRYNFLLGLSEKGQVFDVLY